MASVAMNALASADLFFVLRHGQTPFTRDGLTSGTQDPVLTELGINQAIDAAAVLCNLDVSCVYSSPALRCIQTARIACRTLNKRFLVLPGLMERSWGELEGRPAAIRTSIRALPSSVEPEHIFSRRVIEAMSAIETRDVVVTHSGVFRVICSWLRIEIGGPLAPGAIAMFQKRSSGGWEMDFKLDT